RRGVSQQTLKTQETWRPLEKKEEIKAFLFSAVLNTLNITALAQLEPEEAREDLRDMLSQVILSSKLSLSLAEIEDLLEEVCHHVLGYGPLEPLLQREDVSHIIVNGPNSIFVEVDGKIQKTSVFFKNTDHILNVCRRLLKNMGLKAPLARPLSDLRTYDGSRVSIVLPPLSVEGPSLTIHRASKLRFGFDQLVKIGSLPVEVKGLLETLRCARTNILIAGGRSSGKTTLVNSLIEGVKQDERVIICGDAVGIDRRRSNVLHLETRPQNFHGEGQITMQDLVQSSVLQRAQYLVVDELRGPEVFDLLQAYIEGQEGAIATVFAHSPLEALTRLEDMILTSGCGLERADVRKEVCRLFPIIVQTALLADGSRKVTEIREVVGVDKTKVVLKNLFTFETGEASSGDRPQGPYSFEI
ncbi:MAG: CpaF family protein, partial [Hyphomicrobium sp.]